MMKMKKKRKKEKNRNLCMPKLVSKQKRIMGDSKTYHEKTKVTKTNKRYNNQF